MVLSLARRRWTPEGRRARRATRGRRDGALGWTALAAVSALAAWHFVQDHEAPADGVIGGMRRSLAGGGDGELFITRPEQCASTETFLAGPFFLIMFYSFIGLAVITDEYFEPTLALISEDLGLSPDVAGATFMAAGSSAPELLTSVVDSFISKASVGVGTILGSAMFNLLIIVSGTALFGRNKAGGPLVIQGYPLGRDSFFYLLALGVLAGVMLNDGNLCVMDSDRFEIFDNRTSQQAPGERPLCFVGLITPLEGLLLVLFYLSYILFMVYNQKIHTWLQNNLPCCVSPPPTRVSVTKALDQLEDSLDRSRSDSWGAGERPAMINDDMTDAGFSDSEDDFPGNPIRSGFPNSIGGTIYWLLAFPYRLIFYLTMPSSCMKPGRCRNLLLFFMNIFWITALTLLMVYFATFGGCLLSVDPFIIGIVFLAIGTSVPDALASFIVARDGHGDMAISNALGSNVFDILLGLGLPWFISGLAFPGQVTAPEGQIDGQFVVTNGVITGMITLVLGLFLFIGSLVIFRWRMLKPIAILLAGYYIAFLVLIIMANRCQIEICIELDCSRCGFAPKVF